MEVEFIIGAPEATCIKCYTQQLNGLLLTEGKEKFFVCQDCYSKMEAQNIFERYRPVIDKYKKKQNLKKQRHEREDSVAGVSFEEFMYFVAGGSPKDDRKNFEAIQQTIQAWVLEKITK